LCAFIARPNRQEEGSRPPTDAGYADVAFASDADDDDEKHTVAESDDVEALAPNSLLFVTKGATLLSVTALIASTNLHVLHVEHG